MRPAFAAFAALLASSALAESPQGYALEARLGWYHPRIDSEAGLVAPEPRPSDAALTPYTRVFGDRGFPLFELEFDCQVVRAVGTVGVGVAAGYFAAVGQGLYSAQEDPALAGTAAADKTILRLLPIRALAIWRVDELSRRWNIPFVPYFKLGFGPTFYWVMNGRDEVSWSDGRRAAGSRWGFEGAAGLMFLLDFVDPRIAADFDVNWGVNNSYVFVEFRANRVGASGKPGFVLSDDLFTGGLAFEF